MLNESFHALLICKQIDKYDISITTKLLETKIISTTLTTVMYTHLFQHPQTHF